jgi:hypothetical protein
MLNSHAGQNHLSWRIKERPGFTSVEFSGDIDETADFALLRQRLSGLVVFHLAGVRRLNSMGVRAWMGFVRDLPNVTELTFAHCSPAIVVQLNMIRNFPGPAKVRSLCAPYICESCDREEYQLLDVAVHFPNGYEGTMPGLICDRCEAPMEFDDLPERYLAFLSEA